MTGPDVDPADDWRPDVPGRCAHPCCAPPAPLVSGAIGRGLADAAEGYRSHLAQLLPSPPVVE